MSKRKKSDSAEPRIHLVESDVEHLPEVVIEPEEEEDEIPEETAEAPTWESVKDSLAWLGAAWESVHGVRLAQSDLFSLMYTNEHRQAIAKYLEKK